MSLPANIESLTTALTAAVSRNSATANSAGADFMKLHKNGFFVYGVDDTEVEEGSKWAVNPNTLSMGYIAWPSGGGSPTGEEMALITDAPIVAANLPDVGAEWTQQVGMEMVCISGEDKGTRVIYKTNSKGGLNAFQIFLNAVLSNITDDPSNPVPVVELEVDSYKHKTYGLINTPVLKITKFVGMDDSFDTADEVEDVVEDVVEEPAPRKRRRRA